MPTTDFPATWDDARAIMRTARSTSRGKPLRANGRLFSSLLNIGRYDPYQGRFIPPLYAYTITLSRSPAVRFYPCGLIKIWPRIWAHGSRWKVRRILRFAAPSFWHNSGEPQWIYGVPSSLSEL